MTWYYAKGRYQLESQRENVNINWSISLFWFNKSKSRPTVSISTFARRYFLCNLFFLAVIGFHTSCFFCVYKMRRSEGPVLAQELSGLLVGVVGLHVDSYCLDVAVQGVLTFIVRGWVNRTVTSMQTYKRGCNAGAFKMDFIQNVHAFSIKRTVCFLPFTVCLL